MSKTLSPHQRILTEDVVTLTEAADLIGEATGQRPDRTTVYRWIMRGINGQRLEGARIGNPFVTSKQALNRYFEAIAPAKSATE